MVQSDVLSAWDNILIVFFSYMTVDRIYSENTTSCLIILTLLLGLGSGAQRLYAAALHFPQRGVRQPLRPEGALHLHQQVLHGDHGHPGREPQRQEAGPGTQTEVCGDVSLSPAEHLLSFNNFVWF